MSGQIDPQPEPELNVAGLTALLLCGFGPVTGMFAIGVDLPKIAMHFGALPHAQLLAQLAGGITGLSFALGSPLVGYLIERYGYRLVYILSLAASGILGVLPMLLDSMTLIIITRALLGIGIVGSMTAGMAGLGTLPEAMRARMFGRMAVLGGLGTMVIFPLTGYLAGLGWRLAFLINLYALAVLPLALALPRRPATSLSKVKITAAPGGIGISPGFLLISGFVGMMMIAGPMFAPFYLSSIGITNPTLASVPLSAMSAANLIITLFYGSLHARFGTRLIFAGILFAGGLGMLCAGASTTLLLFTCGMVILSLGSSLFVPNLGASITAAAPKAAARGIGFAMSAIFGVQALFPFVVAGIRALVGVQGVFLGFGIASLLIGAGFLFAAPKKTALPLGQSAR